MTTSTASGGTAPVHTLAIDFGTSNSAAAIMRDGAVHRIPIERGAETLPSVVFFPKGASPMRIGEAAIAALVDGEDGRFMRALKSVLGTDLLHEVRFLSGRRRTLADVITAFLTELRQRAEAATGHSFRRVLSGRPVHFHSGDPEADGRAENDLRACYAAAGFETVEFLSEPEAAAIACGAMGRAGGIGLIVDIGGGTSDFSVFRSASGDAGGRPKIMATGGVRLGGTDFDRALSIAYAMPELGLGGELRREMGAGTTPVPRAPYVDLSTWVRIPFLYTPETRIMVDGMVRLAVDPVRVERMAHMLEMELGHDLAFAVERGKIAVNDSGGAEPIAMDVVEPGLAVPVTPGGLNGALAFARDRLHAAAADTINAAGVPPSAVDRVVFVGGSSLMRFVREEMADLCPRAEPLQAHAFTAVVDGLAMASG